MSETRILRRSRQQSTTIGTTTSTSSTIRFDDMAAAVLHVAGLSTAVATIAVWAAEAADGPYRPLLASDGSPAVIAVNTATTACYALPEAIRAAAYMKLVADAEPGTAATAIAALKS